ncbi:MAG: hypothetical protein V9H26_26965 [Verrucomicrobiota bacterium]
MPDLRDGHPAENRRAERGGQAQGDEEFVWDQQNCFDAYPHELKNKHDERKPSPTRRHHRRA